LETTSKFGNLPTTSGNLTALSYTSIETKLKVLLRVYLEDKK